MTYNLELINGAYWVSNDAGRGKKIAKNNNEDEGQYRARAEQEFDELIESLKKEKDAPSSGVIKSAEV